MKNYNERMTINEMLKHMESSLITQIPSATMRNWCYDSDIEKMSSRGLIVDTEIMHYPFNYIYWHITPKGRNYALNLKARQAYKVAYRAMRVYHTHKKPSLLMSAESTNRFDAYNYAMMHIYDGNQHTVADDNAFRSWHMRKAKDSLDTILINARNHRYSRREEILNDERFSTAQIESVLFPAQPSVNDY